MCYGEYGVYCFPTEWLVTEEGIRKRVEGFGWRAQGSLFRELGGLTTEKALANGFASLAWVKRKATVRNDDSADMIAISGDFLESASSSCMSTKR